MENVHQQIKPDLLEEGKCICIYEPRGDYGLEGYQLDDIYPYKKYLFNGKVYFKVFPIEVKKLEENNIDNPIYGECCSVNQFKKCFNITK